jgi:hypothetical protein
MTRRFVFGLLPVVAGVLSAACSDSLGPSAVQSQSISASETHVRMNAKKSPGGSAGGLKDLPVH